MRKVLSALLVLLLCVAMCGCNMEALLQEFGIGGGQSAPTGPYMDYYATTAPALHVMPNCEGSTVAAVEQTLADLGLQIQLEYAFDDAVPVDCIISQSIGAGETVTAGEMVILVVSKGADESPYGYSQKLTVTAPAGSSRATAVFYEWKNGDWCEVVRYNATVGQNGIARASEGSRRTPEGLHRLGVILSYGYVDTNMPVYRITSDTGVVNDPQSPYYNIIMEQSDVPSGTSFDRIGRSLANGTTYATIYIEHNGNGRTSQNVIPGNGSAIGVRGQYGTLSPTYGDVDISSQDMADLISRLDAEKNPMIEIKIS